MAKDIYHEDVKRILVNDGWKITHDPFRVKYRGLKIEIDLGAERLLAAEKNDIKIAVEIKSFIKPSFYMIFILLSDNFVHTKKY